MARDKILSIQEYIVTDSGQNIHSLVARGHSKLLCILFPDTKGIQWVNTDTTVVNVYEGGGPFVQRRVQLYGIWSASAIF